MSAKLSPERMAGFLSYWQDARRAATLEARLARFLHDYAAVRLDPALPHRHVPAYRTSAATLAGMIARLRGPLDAHRVRGGLLDPWAIAGVGRKEVANCAILASFWSPQVCGTLARDFLDAFCRRIADPDGRLPTREDLAEPYAIRTEHCPVGEASERVDITIEGRTFVLGIEVKIDAQEGHEQLTRYVATVDRWAGTRKRASVVYLSPIKPRVAGVIKAGWSDVAAAGRAVLSSDTACTSAHRFLLHTFIRHCRNFGD